MTRTQWIAACPRCRNCNRPATRCHFRSSMWECTTCTAVERFINWRAASNIMLGYDPEDP